MHCSFCNSRYHNIKGCQNPNIDLLYERIKVIYVDTMNQYPYDTEYHFKSTLNRIFNLRELRVVCVTRANFPASRTKQQIIYALYQYFSTHIYNIPHQEQEQQWLESSILPTQPDTISDFASDLVHHPEEEFDITWHIDTTPSPVYELIFAIFQENNTQEHINNDMLLQLIGDEQMRIRESVGFNSLSHFDEVSGNIPFDSQVKKYNIHPVLLTDEVIEGVEDCAICYESIKSIDMVKLNCEHKFCGNCINGYMKVHNNMCGGPTCALCRTQILSFSIKNPEIYNLVSEHCNL